MAKHAVVALGGMAALALVLSLPSPAAAQEHPTLPLCDRDDPDLLLPDLFAEIPGQIRNTHKLGSRAIAFTTAVGNIGDGPLLVEGRTISTVNGLKTQGWQVIRKRDGSECARLAGEFLYHPSHFHWHFERFVGYELRQGSASGPLVAGGQKTTFCLIDIGMVRGYSSVDYLQQTRGNNCGPEGRQGISVGWKDIYLHNYADQYVELDRNVPNGPVPTGAYILVNHVDPDGLVWETDTSNNISFTTTGVTEPPPGGSFTPPPTYTPRGIKTPDINPPRPTRGRPPRPTIVPRERPTREPRPTRVPRYSPIPVPTATPTSRPNGTPVRTNTPGGGTLPGDGTCNTSCRYATSQVRQTWYDALGFSLSALITPMTCEPLTPEPGEIVRIKMYEWLRWDRSDTGIDIDVSVPLGASGLTGQTSEANVSLSPTNESMRFNFSLSRPSPARAADGNDFPVVYQTCISVGDQQLQVRLVCQPKATGMLCHL